MQITVKSTRVLKKGTNDYGEWKLIGVTTIEDAKYTTLAKDADTIPKGSTINITDMDKDEQGRESFKKFEVIEQASTPTVKPDGDLPPEYWENKQRIERESIEAQTAVKTLPELLRADVRDLVNDLLEKAVYIKALKWCEAKIDANMNGKPPQKAQAPTPEKVATTEDDVTRYELPEFEDGGKLVNYANKHGWKWEDMKMALAEAGMTINNPTEITDVKKATEILFPEKVVKDE